MDQSKIEQIVEKHQEIGDSDFQKSYEDFVTEVVPQLPKNLSIIKYHVMIRRVLHAFWLAKVRPTIETLNQELLFKPKQTQS